MTFEPRIPGTLTVGCAVDKHAACSATGHRKTGARRRFVAGRSFLQAHMALACMLGIFLETRAAALAQPDGELRVTSLRTEYAVNPIGVETERPRLSWKLGARRRGTLQVAYQIRAAHSAEALKRGVDLVWDSGRVRADTSIQLPYDGPPLHSRERTYWQVRVWDNHGLASDWSPVAHFEMGLLLQSDWSAQCTR